MATQIYLGMPPPKIKEWIEKNYKPEVDMTKVPLTFTAEEPNATFNLQSINGPAVTLETLTLSENDDWTTFSDDAWKDYTVGDTITLANVGDRVMFRNSSDQIQIITNNLVNYHKFKIDSGKIAASGNIMLLMDKTGELKDLSERSDCYQFMFSGCTSLTKAPELPATTLANGCYQFMFSGCTSLTKAPELPATTLASYCYDYMFNGCTSLTQPPALPATTLADSCYFNMFNGCTALTQAPELPAENLAESCYSCMFQCCTNLTQAPELPATTLANNCYNEMFVSCTSLTQAPELPATTLANNCYIAMFNGCTKLNNINVNFSAWNPTNATDYWVGNVASSGTFTCPTDLPDTPRDESHIPVGWTRADKQ